MELKQSLRIQVQIAKFSEILTTVTIDYQSTLTYMFSWHRHRKVSEIIQGFRFHWLQISRTHSARYRYTQVSCQILLSSRFHGWQWQAGKLREIINIASRICRTCFKQRNVIWSLTIKIDITKLVNEISIIIGIFGNFWGNRMQNALFMLIMFPNCFPNLLNVLIISTY